MRCLGKLLYCEKCQRHPLNDSSLEGFISNSFLSHLRPSYCRSCSDFLGFKMFLFNCCLKVRCCLGPLPSWPPQRSLKLNCGSFAKGPLPHSGKLGNRYFPEVLLMVWSLFSPPSITSSFQRIYWETKFIFRNRFIPLLHNLLCRCHHKRC